MSEQVVTSNVLSGVPGQNSVPSGGVSAHSFDIIAGAPSSGKTTLVHQLLFA